MTFNSPLSRILARYPRMARAFSSPRSSQSRNRFTNYTHKHYFRLGLGCISLTALSHQFFTKVYHVTPAEGPSMLPTFNLFGDWILIDMRCGLGRDVGVGDLVAYKIPIKRYQMGVKRIIGMPGDFVSTGTPGEDGEDATIQVPAGHCWIVGDNLKASRDSRMYGPLPLGLIQGKVVARILPWEERRWFTNPFEVQVDEK